MIDGIINESQSSRRIKAALPETYEALVALAAAEGIPADVLFSEEGWRQLPTLLNKANLLSDNTEAAIWGNAANRTVDAALKMLADVAYGRVASIQLTVLDTDGDPVPDVTVKLDAAPVVGTDARTDENGYIKLDTDGGTHTVYLVYPMGYTGETSNQTVEVSGTRVLQVKEFGKSSTVNFILTAAKTFYIARYLSPVEFDIRGGGGSGGLQTHEEPNSNIGSSTVLRAQGGAAGYANRTGAIDVAGKLVRIYPAAGGAGVTAGTGTLTLNGRTGGTTTVVIDGVTYSAAGGRGGYGRNSEPNTAGGSRGGSGTVTNYNPNVNTNNGGEGLPLFGDSTPYGGGGGGAYSTGQSSGGYSGAAGSPHGTKGRAIEQVNSSTAAGHIAATYSGGSGGVTAWGNHEKDLSVSSGNGGDGFVAFRKAA